MIKGVLLIIFLIKSVDLVTKLLDFRSDLKDFM